LPECERLADYAVDAKLHIEIVSVGDFVGGDDPGAQRAEGVDGFAEAEDAGLHFAALNVACGDVVENDVAADVCGGFFGSEMLTGLFQDYS